MTLLDTVYFAVGYQIQYITFYRCYGTVIFFNLSGAFDQLKQNATKARIPFYGR